MVLNVYPVNDHDDIVRYYGLTSEKADAAFKMWCSVLRTPFGTKRRVTLTDPMRGNYIVRDTDKEVFGLGMEAA